jgi:hypothetical protein
VHYLLNANFSYFLVIKDNTEEKGHTNHSMGQEVAGLLLANDDFAGAGAVL